MSERMSLAARAIAWKYRLRYDDSLDVVAIHGVGGMVGLARTGASSPPGPERVLPVSGLMPAAIKDNDEANHGRWVLNRN
ncbi:hypothetical protein [Pseudonocardia charpentierae]|uniref:Ammonium transporter AmtB-like domain-containing protein n=1 Tax=Pseudonocardia charpentierae TaxID=3075545 RepID=A0ABU2NH57_9PSEU|nr:hypothetical protein [Pseudonocardia sp. DSM 45834]MDT0352813.1 hypothetical protein [Pseudonocardia sp. DSM 45834]